MNTASHPNPRIAAAMREAMDAMTAADADARTASTGTDAEAAIDRFAAAAAAMDRLDPSWSSWDRVHADPVVAGLASVWSTVREIMADEAADEKQRRREAAEAATMAAIHAQRRHTAAIAALVDAATMTDAEARGAVERTRLILVEADTLRDAAAVNAAAIAAETDAWIAVGMLDS